MLRLWTSTKQKNMAVQVYTLTYTLGMVATPLVANPFLVHLPPDNGERSCGSDVVSFRPYDDSSNRSDNKRSSWLTTKSDVTTDVATTSSAWITADDVSLVRWAFTVASGGELFCVVLLIIVCVVFKSYTVGSSDENDKTSAR